MFDADRMIGFCTGLIQNISFYEDHSEYKFTMYVVYNLYFRFYKNSSYSIVLLSQYSSI